MNTTQNSQNPYDAGSPVSGKNFYGRTKELGEVLDGAKKFIWFISTRRMGKTSLLNQIAKLCQNEPKYNGLYRCLFWNLQGISEPNLERLRKRLTLRTNQPYIPEIDLKSLDSNQSCAQVIESCIEAVSQKGLTLLLLIDEADVFLELAKKEETDFFDELSDCLQLQGIRTVITSTYKLDPLASKNPLLGQFERFFIRSFDPKEGKALICKTNVLNKPPPFAREEQVINEILDKANYSPFFIQKMCEYLYPDKDVIDKQIWDKIFDLEDVDPYFRVDFSGLNDAEKAILCFMINKEENDLSSFDVITGAKEIMPKKGIEIIPTQHSLDVMTRLNILRHKNNKYYIGNPLFRSWLLRDKDNLFCDIIPRRVLPLTPKEKLARESILKIEIKINPFMKQINLIKREYDNGELEISRFNKMLNSKLKEIEPNIRKLIPILREKGAGALADIVEKLLSLSQNDQELLADLKHAVEEGELEEWGSIIHETLEREKHLAPETLILKVSIKVAYSTVRPNQT